MTNPIELMQHIIGTYQHNSKWIDAPLGEIKILSNTHVGSVGQAFIEQWCQALNIKWESPESAQSPWDIKIESVTFEIKTATEDVHSNFQFNHIRYHRDYQAVLCLGISPDEILFDAWRKGEITEGTAGHLVTMDKGSSSTFKLTKKSSDLRPIIEFEERIHEVIIPLI